MHITSRGTLSALMVLVCVASVSCAPSSPPDVSRGKPQARLATVELRACDASIVAEVARSAQEQEIGLMHRKELQDGFGMLFVYDADRKLAFWMKNTLVPLSIAYLSVDGLIKEIHDMKPLSLEPVESGHYVRYALEVPLGWFDRVGLKPGDRFDLSGLTAGK